MQYTFIVPGKLPGLNEYTKANRINRHVGGKMKKDTEDYIKQFIIAQNVPRFNKVRIEYLWIEQNEKRDLDNVSFAKKFVGDALVSCGVLPNDGWKNVTGYTDNFATDKFNHRVEVTIIEVE